MPDLLNACMCMFSEVAEELRVKDTRLGEVLERAGWERHFTQIEPTGVTTRERSRSPHLSSRPATERGAAGFLGLAAIRIGLIR